MAGEAGSDQAAHAALSAAAGQKAPPDADDLARGERSRGQRQGRDPAPCAGGKRQRLGVGRRWGRCVSLEVGQEAEKVTSSSYGPGQACNSCRMGMDPWPETPAWEPLPLNGVGGWQGGHTPGRMQLQLRWR